MWFEEIEEVEGKIEKLQKEINTYRKYILAPCRYCPYDGVYRCEACEENDYEGFKKRDYPLNY